MAARSIWNGVVTFGMVSIPVKMYPATSSKDIAFNELHSVCHSRMKRLRWCPTCNKEVSGDEVVKGYEYTKGQYVEMTDDDFEKVPLPSKRTIEVGKFVKGEQIDPVFYDTAYVLEPDDIGKKPFALFMHALNTKGMIAVAHITIRKREQLCALRSHGGNLMLETLFYSDELRVDTSKELDTSNLSDAAGNGEGARVELLARRVEGRRRRSAQRGALTVRSPAKLEGHEVVTSPTEAPTQVMDLMEALRASVEAAKARRAG